MKFDSKARCTLDAIQRTVGVFGSLTFIEVLANLLVTRATDSALARALWDDTVVRSELRRQLRENVESGRTFSGPTGHDFAHFLKQVISTTEHEHAPETTDCEITLTLHRLAADGLQHSGVNSAKAVDVVNRYYGRKSPTDEHAEAVWAVVDSNVLLHGKFFNQVEWHKEIDASSVVIVVPAQVIKEIDTAKNSQNNHIQSRARQLVKAFREWISGDMQKPQSLRKQSYLQLLYQKPLHYPEDLDLQIPDDRILAETLEFRWKQKGSRTALITNDTLLRFKAKASGIEVPDLPKEIINCK